jgi:hypothetical protein
VCPTAGHVYSPGEGCKLPPATCGDAILNGNETDVDCGGEGLCPRCVEGKACVVHADCDPAAKLACDSPSHTCQLVGLGGRRGPPPSYAYTSLALVAAVPQPAAASRKRVCST